jgi:hypothetical protein
LRVFYYILLNFSKYTIVAWQLFVFFPNILKPLLSCLLASLTLLLTSQLVFLGDKLADGLTLVPKAVLSFSF